MPSLYKPSASTPLHTRQVPVQPVALPDEVASSELSLLLDEQVKSEVERRWREASARLEETERETKRVLAHESQRVLASAREEGYRRGLSEAEQVLQAEMAVLRRSYVELENDRLRFIAENKRDIAALALKMAEVLLRAELSSHPDLLLNLLHLAYDELVAQRKVFVFVHPEKVAQVEELKHLLPVPVDGPVLIRGDSTLDKDSFRLEDEQGGVDYNLPKALKQLQTEICDDAV